jgi:hypothetical protein
MLAVDIIRVVDGNGRWYRPHITPTNGHFCCLAVDAVGILRGSFRIGKKYQPALPFGYARVPTQYLTLELQNDELEKAGCKRLFTNTVSGET